MTTKCKTNCGDVLVEVADPHRRRCLADTSRTANQTFGNQPRFSWLDLFNLLPLSSSPLLQSFASQRETERLSFWKRERESPHSTSLLPSKSFASSLQICLASNPHFSPFLFLQTLSLSLLNIFETWCFYGRISIIKLTQINSRFLFVFPFRFNVNFRINHITSSFFLHKKLI